MKYFNGTREILSELVPRYGFGKTLDVGGGSGRYSLMIKQWLPDIKTFDIDPGADIVGDATNMNIPGDLYDTVLSFQTLEHVEFPEKMVSEIYRVLKPKGVCILNTPFLVSEHKYPTDFQRYTHDGLVSLFKRNGFVVVETDKYGGLVGVLRGMFRFYFDNPHDKQKNNRIKRKLASWVIIFMDFLEMHPIKWIEDENFYNGSYIVARKP